MKLTMKTYTAPNLLQTAEAVLGLPGFGTSEPHSQIESQKSDAEGFLPSRSVARLEFSDEPESLINKGTERDLTRSVADRRESKNGARYRVRTCDPYRVKVVLYH